MTSWLLSVLGKRLLSVNALFLVFAAKRESEPQEICFLFEDSEAGRFYGGSDGASLCFSLNPIAECDLGEYGKLVTFCVSSEAYFSSVVGEKILSASLVHSSMDEAMIGVVLTFGSGSRLSILNFGDEFFVYNDIPLELIASEKLKFISVK
jgi:hypothetical protein